MEPLLVILGVVIAYYFQQANKPAGPRPGRFLGGRALSISEMDGMLANARAGRAGPNLRIRTASQAAQFKAYAGQKLQELEAKRRDGFVWDGLAWDGQRLSSEYFRQLQKQALLETRLKRSGACIKLPMVIETQLRLPSLFQLPGGSTGYAAFAQQSLVGAGQLAGVLFKLWTRAFYLEAVLFAQRMLVVLVQVRYFGLHKEASLSHIASLRRRQVLVGLSMLEKESQPNQLMQEPYVRWMFNVVAPGFYQPHYGQIMSRMAQGDGNYDATSAAWVLTYFHIALFGLIDAALQFDASAKDRDEGVNRPRIDEALNYLRAALDGDWRDSPKKQPLLQAVSPLIGWTPPPS